MTQSQPLREEIEFGLLGPLMVRSGGADLPVPRGHPRSLLAALLLNAGRVVSAGAITQVLWGEEPPASAPVVIRHYIWQLRQVLGEAGPARIITHQRGYLIQIGSGELDVDRFEELLASARTAADGQSWEVAAEQARDALALWRGEPLADVDSLALVQREVPRLAELRLQAEELRLDAVLHLGGQAEAAAELARLAAAHPLREHVHALLMLALYRGGRQADALAAYRDVRSRLVDELGAEPGTELQALHQQILAADPALDRPGPVPDADDPSQAGPDDGGVRPRVPRQLPAAVASFTGRGGELRTLTEMLDQATGAPGTVVISAIGGTAGVGKTALALHWAHQVACRFPGGQLYVNLRGFDPGGAPATPAEAIHGFLDALGVPPERIPPTPDAQQGLYRSLLAGRQMLVVLDNAADEEQVRPLLPASPATLVIITSRRQLTGLAAAGNTQLLSLDVLSQQEAVQLLTARLGSDRAAAEPGAVAQIAQLCACLPLALAVAAARAAGRPGFPLAALASELADATGRLDALDAGDPSSSVRAVFSWSCRQLSPGAARMFRLLGLHPGPDTSAPAAASLAGLTPAQSRHILAELTRAHLLTEHSPGRYAFHDLLRTYAASQATDTDSPADITTATRRMLDHYLHTASQAALAIRPGRDPIIESAPRPGVTPEHLAGDRQALDWFHTEHDVLLSVISLSAEQGFVAHAWQLPCAMADYFDWQGRWQEQAAVERIALAAAVGQGDRTGQAISHRFLAIACATLGDYDEALSHLADSVGLYREVGDQAGEAHAHQTLAWIAERQGRHADELQHAEQALGLYQSVGHPAGELQTLNAVGWAHALLGDYEQARAFCQRALAVSTERKDRRVQAHSWDSLGYAEHHLGHLAQAITCYQRSLRLFREVGDPFDEAEILTHLGDARNADGDTKGARGAWEQALAILEDLQSPDSEGLRTRLAAVGHRQAS